MQNAHSNTSKTQVGQPSISSIPDSEEKVNSKVKYSRKSPSEKTVTISKGEIQKRKANYENEKVYSKGEKGSIW